MSNGIYFPPRAIQFPVFQTFSRTDRERQEIRRNTLSKTPQVKTLAPTGEIASTARSYRGDREHSSLLQGSALRDKSKLCDN